MPIFEQFVQPARLGAIRLGDSTATLCWRRQANSDVFGSPWQRSLASAARWHQVCTVTYLLVALLSRHRWRPQNSCLPQQQAANHTGNCRRPWSKGVALSAGTVSAMAKSAPAGITLAYKAC